MYSKEELQRGLKTRVIGKKIFAFDSIDSTNICVKTLAEAGAEEGAVVIAEHQTAGRGRLGRSWESTPGANLLFSVLLRPTVKKEQAGFLTFYAAVAVARAVEAVTGSTTECKWPNDVLLNGKKCCGILLENSLQGDTLHYSIIGIGLNVNQERFGDGLTEKATSLACELKQQFDRKQILQRILEELDSFYSDVKQSIFDRVLEEWNVRCTMFGRHVILARADREFSGTAVGLSPDGGLILQTPKGRITLYAGDVTLSQLS